MGTFSAIILTAAPPGQSAEYENAALLKLDGRESLLRSVELFLNREKVKHIQVVVSQQSEEEIKRKAGGSLGFMGVKVIVGGKRWQEQLAAAAAKIAADASHVLVHDAARPVVAYSDIDAILAAAENHAAVSLAAPCRSALVELDEGGGPVNFHFPASFMQLLTPQVYSRQRFVELAGGREIHPSELTLVKGSALNVRFASPADASLAKAMMNLLPKPKSKAPSSPFEEAQW